MKIISYNVNGLRAVLKKGFAEWLQTQDADVVCLQEVKAAQADVDITPFKALGYHDYWFCANKKGYSGVTVFTKTVPDNVVCGTGHGDSDFEGRVLSLDFGTLRIINAYFPSGSAGDARQAFKYTWLDEFYTYLQAIQQTHPNLILCGDYNIAHTEIDIHNPAGNKKTSGFLPEERAWMNKLYSTGWLDAFRVFHPQPHQYTWWSQRFPGVRAANKGWRIDYISTTENVRPFLQSAGHKPEISFSDHCPVYLQLNENALNPGL